jgi:16S rRNA (guanine527-N7)-methyltransferase
MPAKTQSLEAMVDRAIAATDAKVGDAGRASLVLWLEKLDEWNARLDLTAARTDEERVDLMLADALVLAPLIDEGARIVDVGSGAGAPGLALALLRPDLRVTLVEPLGKRAAFLRTVLGVTSRADVRIERVRGETLSGRRAWDLAVSRATLAPPAWLDLGATLAGPGGRIAVLLAKEEPPARRGARVEHDLAYTWPLTGAKRRLVTFVLDS